MWSDIWIERNTKENTKEFFKENSIPLFKLERIFFAIFSEAGKYKFTSKKRVYQHAKQVFNAKMCLDENYIQLLDSKQVHKCFCSKKSIPPKSIKWIREPFKISDDQMDKVYTIPYKVMIHTKAKEL